jgi:hypothetical protein
LAKRYSFTGIIINGNRAAGQPLDGTAEQTLSDGVYIVDTVTIVDTIAIANTAIILGPIAIVGNVGTIDTATTVAGFFIKPESGTATGSSNQ